MDASLSEEGGDVLPSVAVLCRDGCLLLRMTGILIDCGSRCSWGSSMAPLLESSEGRSKRDEAFGRSSMFGVIVTLVCGGGSLISTRFDVMRICAVVCGCAVVVVLYRLMNKF